MRPIEEAFSREVLIFRYHLVPVSGKDFEEGGPGRRLLKGSRRMLENSSLFVAVRTGTPMLHLNSVPFMYNPD